MKRLFTKARESGSDPHLAMLCLRSTPVDHHTPSTGDLLNGRRYKANIPVVSTLRDGHVNDSLQRRQDNDKRFHDRRHTWDLPPLCPDESVRVRDPRTKRWEPATVTAVDSNPRSYVVQTADGRYRRNRRHVNKTDETFRNIADQNSECVNDMPPAPTIDDSPGTADTHAPAAEDPTLRRSGRTRRPPQRMNL